MSSDPSAGWCCRRQQAAQTSWGSPWREHALGRDAWPCQVEGRDCLDIALFYGRSQAEPRAVRSLLARGSSPALSHRSAGCELVLEHVGSRQEHPVWPNKQV